MILTLDKYMLRELEERQGLLTYPHPVGWDVRYLELVAGVDVVGFEYGPDMFRHNGQVISSKEVDFKAMSEDEQRQAISRTLGMGAPKKVCLIELNLSAKVSMRGKFPKVPTCCRVHPETYAPCLVFTYWQGIHPIGHVPSEAEAYKRLRAHVEKLTAEGHNDFKWPAGGYTMGELGENSQSWMGSGG